jgi:hypothetical protein
MMAPLSQKLDQCDYAIGSQRKAHRCVHVPGSPRVFATAAAHREAGAPARDDGSDLIQASTSD